MINAELLIETTDKSHRQTHLDLSEKCIHRGGNSTNHKGVLAQYLNTTIPYGAQYNLCHACHDGKCSNPKHLYWGTPKENVEDSIENGTFKLIPNGHDHKAAMTDEVKSKISSTLKGRPSNNPSGKDKNGVHSGGTKGKKYSRKHKQIWINNGDTQTRINIEIEIPEGYARGRL